jgi:hypothetical protein
MICAPQPALQAVGAITCLASLLQHAEQDCCGVLCDAYPRMQVWRRRLCLTRSV